ncbi:MAG: type II 3-dehydroquinate dehydratase [Desulfovibrio sp.]|nr:type II 3-dehydroquinate dehydratase [Desulfovibrio sp.]
MTLLILHGVNLDMFGKRDPAHYGRVTLEEINAAMFALAGELGINLIFFQTNHEGEMVERIHKAVDEDIDAIVVNGGAWTHYSYAIADALAIFAGPIVEVHMSNIHNREEFRARSVFSPVVAGSIAGFGLTSYLLGIRAATELVAKSG